jgi:1,4-dihydroxy-2-naphthoyl-CoA synthase
VDRVWRASVVPVASVARATAAWRCTPLQVAAAVSSTSIFAAPPPHQQQSQAYSTSAAAADDGVVTYTVTDHVATITLNNHAQRNPLSTAVLTLLEAALHSIDASQEGAAEDRVLAVVLKSTGTVFSSGHDFAEFSSSVSTPADQGDILDLCTRVNLGLQQCAPPVIAAVQGMATAGGCQLVASCDLVVASDAAQFCVPGTKIGGFCHTPAVSLVSKHPPPPSPGIGQHNPSLPFVVSHPQSPW